MTVLGFRVNVGDLVAISMVLAPCRPPPEPVAAVMFGYIV